MAAVSGSGGSVCVVGAMVGRGAASEGFGAADEGAGERRGVRSRAERGRRCGRMVGLGTREGEMGWGGGALFFLYAAELLGSQISE